MVQIGAHCSKSIQVPPGAIDTAGRPIFFMRPNKYEPDVIHPDHVIATLLYMLEHLTTCNEKAAKVGGLSLSLGSLP